MCRLLNCRIQMLCFIPTRNSIFRLHSCKSCDFRHRPSKPQEFVADFRDSFRNYQEWKWYSLILEFECIISASVCNGNSKQLYMCEWELTKSRVPSDRQTWVSWRRGIANIACNMSLARIAPTFCTTCNRANWRKLYEFRHEYQLTWLQSHCGCKKTSRAWWTFEQFGFVAPDTPQPPVDSM